MLRVPNLNVIIQKKMDELAIGLAKDGQLILDEPEFNKKGLLERYRLRLVSEHLNTVTRVDNAPYGEMLT